MAKGVFTRMKTGVLALGVLAWTGAAQAQQPPIRVGSFLSVTGPAQFLGDPTKKMMQMEFDRINAAGGLLGRKIEWIVYDDASASDKAVSFAKRLIEDDKIDILIGGSTTATSMAVLPMAEKAQMPFISFGGAAIIVNPVRKWVFKVPHTDRMAAEKNLQDMKARGITKLAMLCEDSGSGKAGREQMIAAAPSYGVTIVADEIYGAKDTDTTAQLTKIRANPDAQALIVWGLGQGPTIVSRNYRQLDMKLPVYQAHGVASKEFITLSGPAAEGMRIPGATAIVADKLPATDRQKPVVMDLTKRFVERYKEPVSAFSANAFDGVLIFSEAVKRAGSVDKEKLRDAIEQTKDLVGANGVYNMSPTEHNGLSFESLKLLEVSNGDWKIIN
jgi:branched-chain amino acid transport system substrate-binding protein